MPRVAFSGKVEEPTFAKHRPSDEWHRFERPLQFVMYLRNFCLYTNFSPPTLHPISSPSSLITVGFVPRPWRFAPISFLMSENYLRHLRTSTSTPF